MRRSTLPALVLLTVLTLLTGCAYVYKPENPEAWLPTVDPIDVKAGLILSKTLRRMALSQDYPMPALFPVGEGLAISSEALCKALFGEVVVAERYPEDVDLVVTPTLVYGHTESFMFVTQDATLTVSLRWRVESPEGELIWLETIRREATSTRGGFMWKRGNNAKRIDAVLEAVFHDSLAAMSRSPEIRGYAEERKADGRLVGRSN